MLTGRKAARGLGKKKEFVLYEKQKQMSVCGL